MNGGKEAKESYNKHSCIYYFTIFSLSQLVKELYISIAFMAIEIQRLVSEENEKEISANSIVQISS